MTATAEPQTAERRDAQGRSRRRDLRPRRRRRVPARRAARDQPRRSRWTSSSKARRSPSPPRSRSRSAKAACRADLPEADRRSARAAPSCATLGHGIQVPVGDGTLGHVWNVIGEPLDIARVRGHRHRGPLGHPPRRAAVRPARAQGADVRDRHQGHRPPRAVRAGRQDRPLRRRRRGQDDPHPGDDQPRRHAARWCVGVRRRRRAHP